MAIERIDLESVMHRYGLDPKEVAECLFPHNKCQLQALYRIQRGEAELDSKQVAELAHLCGVLVSDLYSVSCPDWTSLDEASAKAGFEDDCITLSFGEYKAKINYNGTFITLFHGGKVVDSVVSNSVECMTLPTLVRTIKDIIKKLN